MAATGSTHDHTSGIEQSVAELTRQWVPMLLNRAGVSQDVLKAIKRAPADGQQLRDCLESARRCLDVNGECRRAAGADEILADLVFTLDLQQRGARRKAERMFARTRTRLFRLLVSEPAVDERSWWGRLFARGAARPAPF